MKKTALLLTLALLAGPAVAADLPSLTGTWKGPLDGVRLKGGWLSGDVTIVVSEQKGRSFRGEVSYPRGDKTVTEQIVGTLDSDGDRILIVGDNGHHIAEYDNGVIEDCYIGEGDNGIAACAQLRKQP